MKRPVHAGRQSHRDPSGWRLLNCEEPHYLAGTLYCARCKYKLILSVSTGSRGDLYAYWFCLGRHTHKNGCDLPYLHTAAVEAEVTRAWAAEQLSEEQAKLIRDSLLADLADFIKAGQEAADRLDRRIADVERDRRKWAEKAFEGSVPADIAGEKQAELTRQLASLHGQRTSLAAASAEHEAVIRDATALLPRCGEAYRRGDANLRRDYNQAWFEQILVDRHRGRPQVSGVARTELFEALHRADVRPGSPTYRA